jgi:transposase
MTMIIPPAGRVYMYTKPINMQWGPVKLSRLCTEEIGIDPKTGAVFLFFNKAKDKLKVFFLDDEGSQELMKVMPKGGFMVPVAEDGVR